MAIIDGVFILPLPDQVLFPELRSNVKISGEASKYFVEDASGGSGEVGAVVSNIGVISAKPSKSKDQAVELYNVGTYCRRTARSEKTEVNGREMTVTLSLEGISRFEVVSFTQTSPFRIAKVRLIEEVEDPEASMEVQALVQMIQQRVTELTKAAGPRFGGAFQSRMQWPMMAPALADFVAAGMRFLTIPERQQVLESFDVRERLELVLEYANKAFEVMKMSKQIDSAMTQRPEDEVKEAVLRRQLGEIKKEMRKLKQSKGSINGQLAREEDEEDEESEEEDDDELNSLRESLSKANLSAEAKRMASRELRRLQNMQPHHPEYTGCVNYLETLSQLPWVARSEDNISLEEASAILEQDHYGLKKVKRRILEFLAVQKMRGDMKGPILCLNGPPGVGKTSLGRSVAKALGRKFHRIALGGVRDEAELRGHRRTYIGSMPGAIVQALLALKVNNPVILLDEIDKLTRNAMFNPSGAMLELLDPEQNNSFKDHYVNTPFDLSKVLFLCTCNELHTMDRPLLDRMEIIELSGYTVEEKLHIAMTHLLPKQMKLHALEAPRIAMPSPASASSPLDSASSSPSFVARGGAEERNGRGVGDPLLRITREAIADLVTKWTAESGVRSLERLLAQVCRWAALRLADQNECQVGGGTDRTEAQLEAETSLVECGPDSSGRLVVDARHLRFILGPELFESEVSERLSVGVAMGLGVTSTGGQLLFVEASRSKGAGRLTVTGQLGEVMRESVSTAMSLLRSKIYYALLAASTDRQQLPFLRLELDLGVNSHSTVAGSGVAGSGVADAPGRPDGGADKDGQLEAVVEGVAVGSAGSSGFGAAAGGIFTDLIKRGDATKDPFGNDDVHVHFPAGAIPKDGPSAGVATTLALASLLLERPMRSDTAVTGEITLRGQVLPVGGIRDKVLAAHRAGVRHVMLPFGNLRHAKEDLPVESTQGLEIHFIKHIDEALAFAFGDFNRQTELAPMGDDTSAAPTVTEVAPRARL